MRRRAVTSSGADRTAGPRALRASPPTTVAMAIIEVARPAGSIDRVPPSVPLLP
ncbi:hypothetical protein [Kitasatospora sp. MY 5-36]|uniref:hypothetical protein n=1 Tax=Kitasatospora sp. MY 5-36 TaxID=1678027 RepID=UPI000ACA8F63|nr:hypothetical protein [Kitasatospora sp. MY 5-36]